MRQLATISHLDGVRYEPDRLLQELAGEARAVCGGEFCGVFLSLGEIQYLRAWSAVRPDAPVGLRRLPGDRGLGRLIGQTVTPVLIPDLWAGDRLHQSIRRECGYRSYIGAPLRLADGQIIGALCVMGSRPLTVYANQPQVLKALAAAVSARIEALGALGREAQLNALMQRFLDSSLDIIATVGLDGQIRSVSQAAKGMLGYEPSELVGVPLTDLIHPDDRPRSLELSGQIAQGAMVRRSRERWRHKSGEYVWIEANAMPALTEQEVYCIIRDVAEARQAEESLRQSEQWWRSLFEHNPDGVFSMDLRGRFLHWNAASARITGFAPDEWVGRNFLEMVGAGEQEPCVTAFARCLQGESVQIEVPFTHKLGHQLDLRVTVVPVIVDRAVIGVHGVIQDLTEQNRAREALRAQQELYRLVTDGAGDLVALLDRSGRITYASPSHLPVLGFAPEELIGKLPRNLVLPEDRPQATSAYLAALAGEPSTITLRLLGRNGQPLWFEVRVQPVLDAKGQMAHVQTCARDISEQRVFEERLAYQAYHDLLTHLPNRAYFTERLAVVLTQEVSDEVQAAVLFLDLDNFKRINDSLGHEAGDRLLTGLADRVRSCLPATGMAARLGGDEFVILLERVAGEREAVAVAQRLDKTLREPFTLKGQEVFVTFSIGVALSSPTHGTPMDLLRDADVALYHAKGEGKARWAVFHPEMNQAALHRLALESDLRRAVERREMVVYYQPIVNLGTGQTEGVEALVRWRHPHFGLVPPAEFIPLAEETGLITAIDRQVLESACAQLKAWQQTLGPAAPAFVSVNLSPREFRNPNLPTEILSVLQAVGLEPRCLQVEITESLLMEDGEGVSRMLEELRAAGIHLALDDFGTGYSSLSYLQGLPVDVLKIATPFVRGIGANAVDGAIIRAILMLAEALQITVTAEGIETAEQLAELGNLGCDRGQGYLFAKPLPAVELEAFLLGRAV